MPTIFSKIIDGQIPCYKVAENDEFLAFLDINPNSIEILNNCKLEPSISELNNNVAIQFERMGYFFKDETSKPNKLIFNRTISLRDTWQKIKG